MIKNDAEVGAETINQRDDNNNDKSSDKRCRWVSKGEPMDESSTKLRFP